MNNCTFDGRVGRDAQVRDAGRTKVMSFSLAYTTGFGDNMESTWLNVSLFGQRAEKLAQHVTKGTFLIVTGEIKLRKYTANDGTEKQSLDLTANDIHFVPGTRDSAGSSDDVSDDEVTEDIPF